MKVPDPQVLSRPKALVHLAPLFRGTSEMLGQSLLPKWLSWWHSMFEQDPAESQWQGLDPPLRPGEQHGCGLPRPALWAPGAI